MIKNAGRIKKIITIFCFILSLCLSFASAKGEDIRFKISLDKNEVSRGRQVELRILFFDREDIPLPRIPFIKDLVFKHKRSEKETIEEDGEKRNILVHIYRVVPLKEGVYQIGPLSFQFDGNRYISNDLSLKVAQKAHLDHKEAAVADKKIEEQDISKGIYTELKISKHEAFVNEKIYLTLRVYSDWLDLENIVIEELTTSGLVACKFERKDVKIGDIKGTKYAILEYVMWFFSPEAGLFTIKPIQVDLDIARLRQQTDSGEPALLNNNENFYNNFIGAADSRHLVLKTEPLNLRVLPLSTEGRPDSFKGAIGDFSFNFEVKPLRVKIGEPITLKMVIKGDGNENTINVPSIEKIEGADLYEPQISWKDGEVIFERILRVRSDKFKDIPKATFSFFDPAKKKYISITKGPFKVEIKGLKIKRVTSEKPEGDEKKAKEKDLIVDIKDKPGRLRRINPYFYKNKTFAFILTFPILILCLAYIGYRRIRRFETDPVYAAWIRASKGINRTIKKLEALSKSGKVLKFYAVGFKALQQYFALRLFLPKEGIIAGVVDEYLTSKIDNEKILKDIKEIFADCYLVKFTSLKFDRKDTEVTLKKIREVAEYLNEKDKL